jgi:hypothetical protein
MRTAAITLAAVFALSSCLSAAQGGEAGQGAPHAKTHHAKPHHAKSRHLAGRPVNRPLPDGMHSTDRRPCPIRGMGTSNWFGVDNDANVYRDRPDC